jgi:MHS family proline/betaine transporter-like MFS transporter
MPGLLGEDVPHPPAMTRSAARRALIAGAAGNAMEWYDFAVYGFFAPTIGARFFPSRDPAASLIAAFGVFAAGFLMRPLGAVVFGHIGDRIGRRPALTISVVAMAVPTFLIGVVPDYQQIGAAAALLMIGLRLLQGLSVGGEYTTSMVFLVESAPPGRRGRAGSWTPAGGLIGTILGSAVAAAVSSALPPAALTAWGWRIPFVLGVGVGLAGWSVRRRMDETLDQPTAARVPLIEALRTEPAGMLRVFGMGLMIGVGFYMAFVYAVTFVQQVGHVGAGAALDVNTANMVVLLATTVGAGALSDRIGRRPLLIGSTLAMLLLAYPLFWLLSRPDVTAVAAGQMGFALILGAYLGPLPATMTESFPSRLRCSGLSLAYNLGQAIFGGTTPIVAAYVIARSRDDLSPAFYLMLMAAASLIAVLGVQKKNSPRRRGDTE